MKHILLLIIAICLSALLLNSNTGSATKSKLYDYLPQPEELGQWEATGSPQFVEGDDLFLLINGGAEIYHEYGFKQAIAQGFKNKTDPDLGFNLEIYKMKNPEAAYGIYTFKSSNEGVPIKAGNDGLLEEYYINTWKGNFLVTVIGFSPDKETRKGILMTAQTVTAKIKDSGSRPALLKLLPNNNQFRLIPNSIKYLKGNLALFNQYEFDSKDIFGLEEGIVGNYGNFKLFIFHYKEKEKSCKQFETAQKFIRQNPHFKNFDQEKTIFTFNDNQGIPFYMKLMGKRIFIIQGLKKEDVSTFLEKLDRNKIKE